jgi:hypothetical protein
LWAIHVVQNMRQKGGKKAALARALGEGRRTALSETRSIRC